ncbi:MAG: peptidoglycan-binding protein, partial [Clostridia bacterium]|nr:peptidoglycan-binding protein [Clostridia bacterium]
YVVMKNGDRSYCVRLLQQRLLELGYLPASTKLDGIFGEQTAQALKNFQSVHGLSIIGTGNLETQSILFSEQAVPNTLQ